jgi:hypothetical protein
MNNITLSASSSSLNSEPDRPQEKVNPPLLFILALIPVIGLGVALYLCIKTTDVHWKGNARVAVLGGLGILAIAYILIQTLLVICLAFKKINNFLHHPTLPCCISFSCKTKTE